MRSRLTLRCALVRLTVVATMVSVGLVSSALGAAPPAVSSTVVVVTTTADVVNGSVSSIGRRSTRTQARMASRYGGALTAADAIGGSARPSAIIRPALNGATIEVPSALPPITRDHVVLEARAGRVAGEGRA